MDVVYVVGVHSDELRYSLRSLVNVDHDWVWIVSETLPEWVRNVGHIPVGDDWYRVRNVVEKLYAAATHPEVSETFQYWNDDFFALQPTEVVPRHRGVWTPRKPRGQQPPRLSLRDSFKWTHWLLHNLDVSPIYNYELTHTPMPISGAGLVEAVDVARRHGLDAPRVKTLYGNFCRVGGEEGVNVKAGKATEKLKDPVWTSTNVNSWNGYVGKLIRERFPEPSVYEKGGL